MYASIAPKTRETKYCKAIADALKTYGHATNAQIRAALADTFPALSDTTVHRATARMAERGDIGIAPPTKSGAMRYDTNTHEHDHFMCSSCGMLRDVDVALSVQRLLEKQIMDCHVSGRLTISGICKNCKAKTL